MVWDSSLNSESLGRSARSADGGVLTVTRGNAFVSVSSAPPVRAKRAKRAAAPSPGLLSPGGVVALAETSHEGGSSSGELRSERRREGSNRMEVKAPTPADPDTSSATRGVVDSNVSLASRGGSGATEGSRD